MNRVFIDNMSDLYWLAYLLTGDRERSVQAYTAALNSEDPAPALQRFMTSWARRLVIVAALGTMRQQLRESALRTRSASGTELAGSGRLTALDLTRLSKNDLEEAMLGMNPFQRCTVILTILEGFPVSEAAGFLGADEAVVKAAQARGVAEMTWRLAGVIGHQSGRSFGCGQAAMVAFG